MTTDADLFEVEQALDEVGPGRVVALLGAVRNVVVLACVGAALTGSFALALGLNAWRHEAPGLVLAVVVGIVGTVAPLYVARRVIQLATSLTQPDQVVAQAKDLVVQAKGSPELGQLAGLVRRRGARRPEGIGRLRRAVASGRTISAVIGLAGPDPVRHPLLVPFTPVRLRALWLAITVSLWAWIVAAVVAALAFVVLVLRAF